MSGVMIPGIVLPGDVRPEQYYDVSVFAQNYYVNQFPLISRLAREPVGTNKFITRHTKYRPRNYPIGGAGLNNAESLSVLTLADQPNAQPGLGDSTSLMAGDVIDFDGERVEVIATPATEVGALPRLPAGQSIPAPGTVLIRRGAEGTTVAAHATASVGTLQGNSRTGGEINQSGIRARPIDQTQFVQTWQNPVEISGSVQSSTIIGVPDPFAKNKADQLTNMMRDMEKSSWYGLGEDLTFDQYGNPVNIRPKQKGLRAQCVTNLITNPTNAGAYTSQNFTNDVLERLFDVGSEPDVMFCSSDVLAGLDTWSHNALRINVGDTKYGVNIKVFTSNLAPGVEIVPCTTLKRGTAFIGMFELLKWRQKRPEFWNPRGSRGDALEGEWIAEGAVEAKDEEKHLWIENIASYSAA